MSSLGRVVAIALFTVIAMAPAPALADATFDTQIAEAKAKMLSDPAAAAAAAQRAEKVMVRDGADRARELATAKWLQGEAALRLNNLEKAKPLINQALNLLVSGSPSKLRGDLLLSRGAINTESAQVGAALSDYQTAHNIFRDIGEGRSQAIALISIGTLYQGADDNENALKYYSRALDVYGGDPGLTHTIYNNRGNALKELHRYAAAQLQFEAALGVAHAMKSSVIAAQIYRNIARLKIEQGDMDGAELAIAHGVSVAAGNGVNWRAQFDAISAEIAFRRNRLQLAAKLIGSSFAATDLTKTDLSFREAHYTAYSIYSALGDETRALAHLQAMKRLDDQVWKLSASTNTALMAARFDSANQEARIAKLKADEAARRLELEQAQSRFERILFGSIAAAAAVVLALLAAGLVQSRRARVRLSASNTALARALAAKTEFLATTSHEIRTPLNGILGMTQVMLADARLEPKLRDRVGIVHDAGLTMRSLVDDILDVAKMEAGNLTVERLPFDLKALLEDVTRMWAEQAHAKGLAFTLELDDCPRGLLGDAGRVRQVVYNLLSNAVKFTSAGGVTVRAACGDGRLTLTVADTGIGIATDKHDEIFESFKQADGGTTRQFGGTGLGLAIVRNIAVAMGGTVLVDSAPGAGSTFTIDLPFVTAELAAPVAAHVGGGLLVVDRNPIARAMLKAVLEPRAGSVTFAASCTEATDMVAKGEVARVLIDEATARLDGADPVAQIAAVVDAGRPVAILWVQPDDATRAALIGVGVAQVIAKPIAGPALAAALYSDHTQEELVTQAA